MYIPFDLHMCGFLVVVHYPACIIHLRLIGMMYNVTKVYYVYQLLMDICLIGSLSSRHYVTALPCIVYYIISFYFGVLHAFTISYPV